MQYSINNFSCISDNCANTGAPKCTFKPGFIGGLLLVPDRVFTAAEIADFVNTLQAAAVDDTPANRIIPIKPFTTVEPADSEAVYETAGSSTFFVQDGKLGITARLDESEWHWRKLRKYNNKHANYRAMIIDTTNNGIQFVKSGTGGKGFTLDQLAVPQPKLATNNTLFSYSFKAVFKYLQEFENMGFVQFEKEVNALEVVNGLIDFEFIETTAITNAGVYKCKLMASGQDLGDLFGTELADPAAYTATIDASGVAVTIATVTHSSVTGVFTFTFTFPSTSTLPIGGTFTLNSGAPSVLTGLNVPGYSGCPVTLTRIS